VVSATGGLHGSLIAIPSEPGVSGILARMSRPDWVRFDGLGCTCAPGFIIRRRTASWSKLIRTMKTLQSRPHKVSTHTKGQTHLPAPVSVVRCLMPNCLIVPCLRDGGVWLGACRQASSLHVIVDAAGGAEAAFPSRRARVKRAGRYAARSCSTSSGISIHRWVETSCSMMFIGKTGASCLGRNPLVRRGQRRLIGVGRSAASCTTGEASHFFKSELYLIHCLIPVKLIKRNGQFTTSCRPDQWKH